MRITPNCSAFTVLLLLSLCLVSLAPSNVAAQVDEKEKAEKETERRKDLQRKAVGLLDEIAAASWGLKLPENRSLVQASAADLLWRLDEKRARNLYWEALSSLGLPNTLTIESATTRDAAVKGPASKDATKRPASDQAQTLKQYYEMYGLRRDFLRRVAQRDPQLALEMLRATRLRPPDSVSVTYRLPDERDLEQEIASVAVARDPKQALQIARESLAKGLTFQLLGLLYDLNRLSPETATEFAGDLIDKIHTLNLATDAVAWRMSIEILRLSRLREVPAGSVPSGWSNQLKLSEDQKRELVELLTNAALSASAQGLAIDVSEIMPEVEQFAPDRVANIRTRIAERRRTLPREELQWLEHDTLVEKGTPEELLKAAARASDDLRQQYYEAAIAKAIVQNKTDALRDYIKNNIEDESQRKRVSNLLHENQIGWATYKGDIETLQKLLPLIAVKPQRAEAMANIAMLLEKKGEHAEAAKMVDDAMGLVKVDLSSEKQSTALMAVLLAYSLIDPAKAFAIIEPIIDRANDDISRLLLLDRIVNSGVVKNGEIMMQQPGGGSFDFAILKFGPGVVALANADFNRTKAAADRFQRNELRILARLMIAQALLQDKPQVGGTIAN
ncbi:MAG: hypothetical protein AABM67_00220 [Acidobacteriota bacterium]